MNVSLNCLDRHLNTPIGNKAALIWEGEPDSVSKPGEERVLIYLPMVPEAPIAMLACARIGAIHSVVFGGFSAHAVADRIHDCGAKLVIRKPWPSMLRGLWGDPQRYRQVYWNEVSHAYFTGDGCRRDADGYFWIVGRIDDVLNVAGHRIGTAEAESALVSHPSAAACFPCTPNRGGFA